MATITELSENSHQGFEGIKAALCLASMDAKSNTASGLPVCLRQEGIGSRCSGKERDETGLDFFEARYFSSTQGRFTRPDPYNIITRAENKDHFVTYIKQPQNWNRYAYVWNNPLRYVDPTGEVVYIVLYTVGNNEGDEEWKKIAETLKKDIKKSAGYSNKYDQVLLKGISSKDDMKDALKEAKNLEGQFGKVHGFSLVSHGGPDDGPVFPQADSSGNHQFFGGENELKGLDFNFTLTAKASFYGCDTAVNFSQSFANAQGVRTWGFDQGTSLSNFPNYKSKSYFLNFGSNRLYMIGRDGRQMVKRDPISPTK